MKKISVLGLALALTGVATFAQAEEEIYNWRMKEGVPMAEKSIEPAAGPVTAMMATGSGSIHNWRMKEGVARTGQQAFALGFNTYGDAQ